MTCSPQAMHGTVTDRAPHAVTEDSIVEDGWSDCDPSLCIVGDQHHTLLDAYLMQIGRHSVPVVCTYTGIQSQSHHGDSNHVPRSCPYSSNDCVMDTANGHSLHSTFKCKRLLLLNLDPQLAGCVTKTAERSSRFSQGFLWYAQSHGHVVDDSKIHIPSIDNVTFVRHEENSVIRLAVNIVMSESTRYQLDYAWNEYVGCLVMKRMLLEDAMCWLNTLGGGYSALGDFDETFAEHAGRTTIRQFKVALELGDPPTIVRCHLFMALSLMQRGYFKSAKHIIRNQYKVTLQLPVVEHRLVAMCHGMWNRLGYLWRKHRECLKDTSILLEG